MVTPEYEACMQNLQELAIWYSAHASKRNEATTRLHLIDDLFTRCLGWSKEDIVCEESHRRSYADYTFSSPRRMLIVEAKKEGVYFDIPAGETSLFYALPLFLKSFRELVDPMQQVSAYCQSRGVPFGAVSNGNQIIAFIATRSDGNAPFEGKAIVFPSLEFMLDHFYDLWQTLSKPGVENKNLYTKLAGEALKEVPPKLSAKIPRYPGVKGRNPFQADLQILSEWVVEDIPRAPGLETDFLRECYCQSGALSQHALIAKGILRQRYAALFNPAMPGPTTAPIKDKHGLSVQRQLLLPVSDNYFYRFFVGALAPTIIRQQLDDHLLSPFDS